MERVELRLKVLKQALETLQEPIEELPHVRDNKKLYAMIRDSQIQRFEYTYECLWQFLKDYLRTMYGKDVVGPNSIFKQSYATGIINKSELITLSKMAQDRNLTSHTYLESVAQRISLNIESYFQTIITIVARLEQDILG